MARGAKPSWPRRIDAPADALRFYELVASMSASDSYRECHVFNGAADEKGVPLFKFGGRVHAMPKIFCTVLGLEYGRTNCGTRGCINPFHYAVGQQPPMLASDRPEVSVLEGTKDLLDYYIEEKGVEPLFHALRVEIPMEDLSNEDLHAGLSYYLSKRES